MTKKGRAQKHAERMLADPAVQAGLHRAAEYEGRDVAGAVGMEMLRLQQIQRLESRIVKQKAHIDKLLTDCPFRDSLQEAIEWGIDEWPVGNHPEWLTKAIKIVANHGA